MRNEKHSEEFNLTKKAILRLLAKERRLEKELKEIRKLKMQIAVELAKE